MDVTVYGRNPIMPPGAGGGVEPWTQDIDGRQGYLIFSGTMNLPSPPATFVVEIYTGWRIQGTQLGREVATTTRTYVRVKLVAGVSVIYVEQAS